MLVLTRRKDESIVIDVAGGIEITVVEANNNFVRLGIKAPRSVNIWRKEILLEVTDANKAAASTAVKDLDVLESLLKKRPSRSKKEEDKKDGEQTTS